MPLADAVNVPLHELQHRTHELPDPAMGPVSVADTGEIALRTVRELERLGRPATVTPYTSQPESQPPVGRLWSPTEFLRDWLTADSDAQPGSALDLGCGTGRDAVYLGAHGWSVSAVDVDPTAITRGAALQSRYPVAADRIAWRVADVELWTTPARDASFDLIVSFRFLPRRFLQHAGQWLSPRGTLLVETFSPAHAARHGRPASRERVLSVDDATAIARSAGLHVQFCEPATRGWVESTRLCAVQAG